MRRLSRDKNLRFRQTLKGQVFKAVVISKKKPMSRVLTENYLEVLVPDCAAPERDLVNVHLEEVEERRNVGRIL